jgi:glycosyltransferase involved in cell wall biosynthesis
METNTKKILIVVSKYKGNSSLINNMVFRLIPMDFHFKVCYLGGEPDGKNVLDQHGLTVYLKGDNSKGLNISTLSLLSKVVRTEKPDILHCHRHKSTTYGVLASAFTKNIKIISHVHGLGRTRTVRRKLANALITGRISRFVVVSDAVKEDVIKNNLFIKPSKVLTIKNGIDLDNIDTVSATKSEIRSQLGLPSDEVLFGTVGRLARTKGQIYLLRAFTEFVKRIPNSRLVLVGNGPLHKELRREAETLGIDSHISFLGFRNDVYEILHALDLFILPSVSEGLALALLEAMAARLPIIATDVGGIPEVFGKGEFGRLVPPRDVHELFSAMLEIYFLDSHKKMRLGENARKRVEEEFTVNRMCQRLAGLYESMLH